MRRMCALILCLMLLTTTAYAANGVSSANSTATVSLSGECEITLSATIRLDEAVSGLRFPLGQNVSGVSLNGGGARVKREKDGTWVNLSHLNNQTGSFPVTLHYTVSRVVTQEDGAQEQVVTIPLLSGFPYPVEQFQFTVTMPGEFQAEPEFYSGYHGQDIERNISYTVNGSIISGTVETSLKDSETLYLSLVAPEGMFPQSQRSGGSLKFDHGAMAVFAALTVIYWLVTMAHWPVFANHRSTPPESISAGVVGSILSHKPGDLTMMVIHWAQLGYLVIRLDDRGRVILHKKMEMGNERNAFEQRCFRNLFGTKQKVEATGERYARLVEATARSSRRYSAGFQKGSGNPRLLQILATVVGLFAGIALGDLSSSVTAWRVVWMVLLSLVGAGVVWQLQEGMYCLRTYGKGPLIYGVLGAIPVCVAGFVIQGGLVYAGIILAWGCLAGWMGAFGGKRTENGRRNYLDLVGLRRYMGRVSGEELTRILKGNPDYYYELVPFAYAMGVERRFTKGFGSRRIPRCTWLVTSTDAPVTAGEWAPLLRETVEAMNALSHRPFWEKYGR